MLYYTQVAEHFDKL